MHARSTDRRRDEGFTLVELLIVIVILGVLATVTVFAVRGITDQGETSATDADERTLESAQEAYMAQEGEYGSEADLVAAGLLRGESTLHDVDVAVDRQSYTVVVAGSGGGGGGPVAAGTPIPFGTVPAMSYGSGPTFIVVGGSTTLAEWNALVNASTSTAGKTMIFVNVADVVTPAQAEALHDAAYVRPRVFSVADDIPNFSGGDSLITFMERSNGLPVQGWAKIHDGILDTSWAFAFT